MLHLSKMRIMELFFEEPNRDFQIREVSRLSGLAVTSVKKHLDELVEEGLLRKNDKTLYPSFVAEYTNPLFVLYKKYVIMVKILESGVLDYIEKEIYPSCIVLFGSVSKGEYQKSSDIDMFIQAGKKDLNITAFEKKLKHEIHLIFEADLKKLSPELLNNIINGDVVSGYLKIK